MGAFEIDMNRYLVAEDEEAAWQSAINATAGDLVLAARRGENNEWLECYGGEFAIAVAEIAAERTRAAKSFNIGHGNILQVLDCRDRYVELWARQEAERIFNGGNTK